MVLGNILKAAYVSAGPAVVFECQPYQPDEATLRTVELARAQVTDLFVPHTRSGVAAAQLPVDVVVDNQQKSDDPTSISPSAAAEIKADDKAEEIGSDNTISTEQLDSESVGVTGGVKGGD